MHRYLLLMSLLTSGSLAAVAQPTSTNKAPAAPAIAEPAPEPNRAEFGKNIPRTMALLAGSTPQRRWPVKIVFYGQSITVQSWWRTVADDLRTRFPNAEIRVDNLAIGGYGYSSLRRTAEHDLFPNYPDLILLQAYGAGGTNLENLVADIRSRTTAEIMLCTHHVCIPGRGTNQTDAVYQKAFEAHQKARSTECDEIRHVAAKYGCELADVRIPWEKYLRDNKLEPKSLLGDHIHLNDKGNMLMARLIGPHFQYVPGAKNPWSECIQTRAVQPGRDGRLQVMFKGNRIDVIASAPAPGVRPAAAKVLIDGKPPSANPLLYAITRPSKSPHAWYPAINRVDHKTPLLVEDWTVRFTKVSADGTNIEFEVSGSKTGPDGSGNSRLPFTSNSGRVVIDPKDWSVAGALKWFKKPMPDTFQVTWAVIPQFVDVYQPPEEDVPGLVRITMLAQGLASGPHTLELIPEGEGRLAIESVRIHCPPGKAHAPK